MAPGQVDCERFVTAKGKAKASRDRLYQLFERAVMPQPQQPVIIGDDGIRRYVGNAIVQYITEHGGFDPEHLSQLDFLEEDWQQYKQLLGWRAA